jgi:hypothetical protein
MSLSTSASSASTGTVQANRDLQNTTAAQNTQTGAARQTAATIRTKPPSQSFEDIQTDWNQAHESLSKSFQELTAIFAEINYLLKQLQDELGALGKNNGLADCIEAGQQCIDGMSALNGGVSKFNIHLQQLKSNNLNNLSPEGVKTLASLESKMADATSVFNGIKVGASVPTTTQNGQRVQTQRQARNGTGATNADSEASEASEKSRRISNSSSNSSSETSSETGSETSSETSSEISLSSSETSSETSDTSDTSLSSSETSKTSGKKADASYEVGEIKTELESTLAKIKDGSAQSTQSENEDLNNVSSISEYDGSVEEPEDLEGAGDVSSKLGGGATQSTEESIEDQVNIPQNIGNNKNGNISETLVDSTVDTENVGNN